MRKLRVKLDPCVLDTGRTKERFDILEEFLLRRLDGVQIDPRVEKALLHAEECRGQLRATQLARYCKVSAGHLNRLLRTWLGFSSKRLARITRFQALLQRVEDSRPGGSRDWPWNWATMISPTLQMRSPNSRI